MSSTPDVPASPENPATEHTPATGTAHSCEHCSGGGDAAPDPVARAREHLAVARRRVAPRLILAVLGLLVALVLASRHDQPLPGAGLTWVAAALAWLPAAWGGVVLGAALGSRRGPWARLALGQVLAAALAPVLALVITLGLGLADLPRTTDLDDAGPTLLQGVPYGVAAAAGWFLAAAAAETVRLRALGRAVDRQDETGLQARGESHGLTTAVLQRAELVALGVALAFGAVVLLLTALPWAALVLVPLAAVVAATLGLRQSRPTAPSDSSGAAAADPEPESEAQRAS